MNFTWQHDKVNDVWSRSYVGGLFALIYWDGPLLRLVIQDRYWSYSVKWIDTARTLQGAKRIITKQAKRLALEGKPL